METGDIHVMVATIAFGMRSTSRTSASCSTTTRASHYQEIRRAGRDAEPAQAVLFYRQQDFGLRRFFASGGVRGDEILHIGRALRERGMAVRPVQLAETLPLSDSKLATAVQHLVRAGFACTPGRG